MSYYDGTKLLSLKDSNGKIPEIYICVSNRTAGKTTYFGRLLVNRFIKQGKKFCLLYRFRHEISDVEESFFKDIGELFFKDREMTSKSKSGGIYRELYLDGVPCGYALSINSADAIKRKSHLFSDVDAILMDEFQSETNHYCPDEINKFYSVHTSIARGKSKQVRYVPVYMLSNAVTLLNPYFTALGISNRISNDTKFLKGDGFVLEQGYIESATIAQQQSAFARAFKYASYYAYSSENVYLNDNYSFVENITGKQTYIATIKCDGKFYAIKEYPDRGVVYVTNKADLSFPFKISVTTEDHDINYVMLNRYDDFISTLRFFFSKGAFRFKNLECKGATMKLLSY